MSAELGDLKRLKITAETQAWLQAEAKKTGKSQQEIARDVLHGIALEQIRGARLLLALAPPQAHAGDGQAHIRAVRGRRP
jgi:hypothetical protein